MGDARASACGYGCYAYVRPAIPCHFLRALLSLSYLVLSLLSVRPVVLMLVRVPLSVMQLAGLILFTVCLSLLTWLCRALTPCLTSVIRPPRCYLLVSDRFEVRVRVRGSEAVGVVAMGVPGVGFPLEMPLLLRWPLTSERHLLMLFGTRASPLLTRVNRLLAMCLTRQWLREMSSSAFGYALSRLLTMVSTLALRLPLGLLRTRMPGLLRSMYTRVRCSDRLFERLVTGALSLCPLNLRSLSSPAGAHLPLLTMQSCPQALSSLCMC